MFVAGKRARNAALVFGLLLVLAAAGLILSLKWAGRGAVRFRFAAGAMASLEVHDLSSLWKRFRDTNFFTHMSRARLMGPLEQTTFLRGLDEVLRQARAATGLRLGREDVIDLFGNEAALALYPPPGKAPTVAVPQWIAGFRLKSRDLALARGLIAWEGRSGDSPVLEMVDYHGRHLISWASGYAKWPRLYAFFAGPILVVGSDRELVGRSRDCRPGGDGCLATVEGLPGESAGTDEVIIWADFARGRHYLTEKMRAPSMPAFSAVLVRASFGKEARISSTAWITDGDPLGGIAAAGGLDLPRAVPSRPALLVARSGSSLPQWSSRLLGGSGSILPEVSVEEWCLLIQGFTGDSLIPLPRWELLAASDSSTTAQAALHALFPSEEGGMRLGGEKARFGDFQHFLGGEYRPGGIALENVLLLASDSDVLEDSISHYQRRTGGFIETALSEGGLAPTDQTFAIAYLDGRLVYPAMQRMSVPLAAALKARFGEGPDYLGALGLLSALKAGTARLDARPGALHGVVALQFNDLAP